MSGSGVIQHWGCSGILCSPRKPGQPTFNKQLKMTKAKAIKLFKHGKTAAEVAETFGCSLTTAYRWKSQANLKTPTKKGGRPVEPRGAYNPDPPRQLGRVSDEEWEMLREAASIENKTFTRWALDILLPKAKKIVFGK